MFVFEETKHIRPVVSWLLIITYCVGIIVFGVLCYSFIRETPRQWDFGAIGITPAESVYSTFPPPPPSVSPERQLEQLPEAKPWKRPGGKP